MQTNTKVKTLRSTGKEKEGSTNRRNRKNTVKIKNNTRHNCRNKKTNTQK
jgi:hypothetical protein